MKHRVREAMFNLVGPAIKGTLAIDLFAGTGAIGFEALSRGATNAILVERHLPTTKILEGNAKTLAAEQQCEIVFGDTFVWSQKFCEAIESSDGDTDRSSIPWAVFCSPPYSFYDSRVEEMRQLIDRLSHVAPSGSLFIMEFEIDSDLSSWRFPSNVDARNYPPARIAVWTVDDSVSPSDTLLS